MALPAPHRYLLSMSMYFPRPWTFTLMITPSSARPPHPLSILYMHGTLTAPPVCGDLSSVLSTQFSYVTFYVHIEFATLWSHSLCSLTHSAQSFLSLTATFPEKTPFLPGLIH